MDFSPQQDQALSEVNRWIKSGESQIFRLFGYAGTGKTTLARHLAEGVDGDALFALSSGDKETDFNVLGATAAEVVAQAIVRAIRNAETLAGVPAAEDVVGC